MTLGFFNFLLLAVSLLASYGCSRSGNCRAAVGRSFSHDINSAKSARLQPPKYAFCDCHNDSSVGGVDIGTRGSGLQNFLNLGVDRNVSLRKPADLKGLAGGFAEVEEAADVVILVEHVENALGLFVRKAQRFDRHGFSVAARRRQIFVDYVRASSWSDPDVRASFAVRQIHVEHVCFRDALERREQVARAVPCAERQAGRGGHLLHFIQARDLLVRKPEPGGGETAFRARAARLRQALANRLGNFRPQSYWFEIRLRHEKILREYLRIRLEGYHASRERFQLRSPRRR